MNENESLQKKGDMNDATSTSYFPGALFSVAVAPRMHRVCVCAPVESGEWAKRILLVLEQNQSVITPHT
jgi:hypothetical protein